MPKMKTHTATAKRVKVTGRGKLMAEQAGLRHLLESKSSRVTRRLSGKVVLAKADQKRLKRLLAR